ncbi:helix-turn-helix transcriptional regulator [Streptomyces sp. PKU-EA00015]|uniref:helix-turn-helix domain-containing protein n=1 Tax=Streptomyces sp. PKU-EA00015 TaxID=2748326 RepID=UPI0015A049E3|nr:helix-turn-helix transcriptional regulator [Streptomyces sp. PKU-EA00015]NWF25211.1 helix-turn-helix transcriptional regulator [Streptomyces sp. PKU-EA00015]
MLADQPQWISTARQALGRRIAGARVDASLTQEKLAERAGIDRSTIQRIELGQNDARFSHLLLIASALELPLRELIPEGCEAAGRGD